MAYIFFYHFSYKNSKTKSWNLALPCSNRVTLSSFLTLWALVSSFLLTGVNSVPWVEQPVKAHNMRVSVHVCVFVLACVCVEDSGGQRRLVGYCLWGRKESDPTWWLNNNNMCMCDCVRVYVYLCMCVWTGFPFSWTLHSRHSPLSVWTPPSPLVMWSRSTPSLVAFRQWLPNLTPRRIASGVKDWTQTCFFKCLWAPLFHCVTNTLNSSRSIQRFYRKNTDFGGGPGSSGQGLKSLGPCFL